jgi:hypothetical protein
MTPPSPPPPPLRSTDDGSAAESARRRFTKGRHLTISIPPFSNLKLRRARDNPRPLAEQHILSGENDDATEISLNEPCIDLNIGHDIYRWAVVYENQRGFAFTTITSDKGYLSTLESPFFQHHIIPVWDCSRMTHLRSPFLKRTVEGTGSLKCPCMTTHSPMGLGAGFLRLGWLTCAAKVKSIMTALSIIGSFVATSGAPNLARSMLEAGYDAEDGCAL